MYVVGCHTRCLALNMHKMAINLLIYINKFPRLIGRPRTNLPAVNARDIVVNAAVKLIACPTACEGHYS